MRLRLPAPFCVETEADLANDLFAALQAVTRGLTGKLRREAARCGLSLAEAQLLAMAHDAGTVPPLDDVILDGFRARDVAEALRDRGLFQSGESGLQLSGHGTIVARHLATRAPLWDATPLVGAVRKLGRPDSEELTRLLRALADLVGRV